MSMKKLALAAALSAALVACGDAAEESDEPVAPAATETAAAEGWAGTYEFEVEGKTTTSVLMADGTYTDTVDGEVVESGTWEENAEGQVCFDPPGEDTPVTCFTAGEPGEDGTFVATPDEGEPLTIRKVS
jgi:hypothetical protein